MKQHSVKIRDGLRLAVDVFGGGPPLVFAHGLSGNRRHTKRQLAPLANRHTIIAFDQRGHGESTPVTQAELYDLASMAHDIAAILRHLKIDKASIGGESMGAATALTFALKFPQQVDALLMTGPAFGNAPNPQVEHLQALADMIRTQGMDFCLETMPQRMQQQGASEKVIATIREMWRSHNPESLATALATVSQWVALRDFACLRTLDFPVKIIAWENDPLHSLALAKKLSRSFANAELQIIPSLFLLFERPQVIGETYAKMLHPTPVGSRK